MNWNQSNKQTISLFTTKSAFVCLKHCSFCKKKSFKIHPLSLHSLTLLLTDVVETGLKVTNMLFSDLSSEGFMSFSQPRDKYSTGLRPLWFMLTMKTYSWCEGPVEVSRWSSGGVTHKF